MCNQKDMPLYWKRSVKVLEANIGLLSNNRHLIFDEQYFGPPRTAFDTHSIFTRYRSIEDVDVGVQNDSEVYVIDIPKARPSVSLNSKLMVIVGDITLMEEMNKQQKRLALFGNGGLFVNYVLLTLETYHRIFSYHASVLYDPDEKHMYVILGGAGAGKTVFIMEGILTYGMQVFSTEMAHIRIDGDRLTMFKGSVWDNIRIGTFIEDFPEAAQKLGVDVPEVKDPWSSKIAVSFEPVSTPFEQITNPDITLIFARVETGRQGASIKDLSDKRKVRRLLFENLLEKTCKVQLLAEEYPVPPLDSEETINQKLRAVDSLLESAAIKRVLTVLSGPKSCWDILGR